MADCGQSCVPPGFRFHPTDEELVGYYLKKKMASQKIDLDVIREIDLYRIEPWDLQERCRIGYEEQNEWYFFSHKDRKYPTGMRTNRATMAGFWKATGRDKAVYDKLKLIGMRKTLVFYGGRAPNGHKTDWIMHEYRLESEENAPPQEEGWVVCRAFKKRATSSQTKYSTQLAGWDSSTSYLYNEPSTDTAAAAATTTTYTTTNRSQPHNFLSQNLMCKQEIPLADSILFSDHFNQMAELPQLESPSLPLTNRPSSKNNVEEDDEQMRGCNNNSKKLVTDWRALDKFVASQLSQENRYESDHHHHAGGSSFEDHHEYSDMALLLLQGGREEEGNELYGLLGSNPDRGIGICIFDK